jgi:hypothetical protein
MQLLVGATILLLLLLLFYKKPVQDIPEIDMEQRLPVGYGQDDDDSD